MPKTHRLTCPACGQRLAPARAYCTTQVLHRHCRRCEAAWEVTVNANKLSQGGWAFSPSYRMLLPTPVQEGDK